MLHQRLEHGSFVTFKKEELFDRLLNSIEQGFPGDIGDPLSLAAWAIGTPIVLDGKPFYLRAS